MEYTLGIITGLLVASVIVATLAYFRRVIEHKTTIIEKQIDHIGPRPKGRIVMPEDEAEESRQKIIARNREQGRDTPLDDLR